MHVGVVGNIQFDAVLQQQAFRAGNFSQTWGYLENTLKVRCELTVGRTYPRDPLNGPIQGLPISRLRFRAAGLVTLGCGFGQGRGARAGTLSFHGALAAHHSMHHPFSANDPL
jgi:hypothetical protein